MRIDASPSRHQFILWSHGFSWCPNFLPQFDDSQKNFFTEIAIGSSLDRSFYDAIHSCSQPEPLQVAELSVNQNSSVDQVNGSLSSGKVTNNQTLKIKPSEPLAEDFEMFIEAVEKKVSSRASTEFNKSLQSLMKRYESFTENQKITEN